MSTSFENKQAKNYNKFADSSYSWNFIEKPAMDENLKPMVDPNKKILDLGCGHARSTKLLLEYGAQPEHITAVDNSSELLKQAKTKLPTVKFVREDIRNFYPEKEYDLITAIFVLHFLDADELLSVLKKMHDSLRKKGQFFFLGPHPVRHVSKDLSKYFKRGKTKIKTPWDTTLEYFYRPMSDCVNSFINAGFKIDKLIEPEIIPQGEKDKDNFEKYSQFPSRMGLIASKQS